MWRLAVLLVVMAPLAAAAWAQPASPDERSPQLKDAILDSMIEFRLNPALWVEKSRRNRLISTDRFALLDEKMRATLTPETIAEMEARVALADEQIAQNTPQSPPIATTLAWQYEEVLAIILITAVVLFALFVLWRLSKWFPAWIRGNWRGQLALGAVLCASSIGALLVVYAVDHDGYGERDDWEALRHPGSAFTMLTALAIGAGLIVYAALRAKART